MTYEEKLIACGASESGTYTPVQVPRSLKARIRVAASHIDKTLIATIREAIELLETKYHIKDNSDTDKPSKAA